MTGTNKKKSRIQAYIKDKEGNILFEKEKIEARRREYSEELYEDEDRPAELIIDGYEGSAFRTEEVKYAMKRMKNRKAPGIDEIKIKQFKALDDEGIRILTDICNEVYSTEYLPHDLKNSIFVKLPKKSNAINCMTTGLYV